MRRLRALAQALLALVLLLNGTMARADTPLALFQAFRGQVNFTGTEETLRTKNNNYPCRLTGGGIYAYLGGIPKGATVQSAQLYWAGSGSNPDYTVTFDGVSRTAPASRRYTSSTIGGGYNYFSGAVDVTSQVAAKGNGYYTFSGLSVANGYPWCGVQGVVGGFSLLVVYSHPNEAYRLLNLYEGFQYFRNSGFTLTLNNFAIPDPLPGSATGRVGHITWEGDSTLSQGGEDLLFNGYEMTDWINPSGNQFNSASNVTGDRTSYGIDFDAYTVGYPVIKPGQTTATTTYRSGQDMVLLSAEVAALPYIPVSDLALSMTRSGELKVGGTASYALTVTNNGPDTETGPVTVVDTLPAGLSLVSARGTGWTCGSAAGGSGQTVVTCSASGPVASGAAMNPLTLVVSATKAGNYTNSATVSGQTRDSNPGNNTATDTTRATDPNAGAAVWLVFTARACNAGDTIGPDGCPRFGGTVTADTQSSGQIFITSVDPATGKATVPAPAGVSAQLWMTCASGASTLSASYVGAKLDCKGTQRTVQLLFGANPDGGASAVLQSSSGDPNSASTFAYPDVGQLTLSLSAGGATVVQRVISSPAYLVVAKASRIDGTADLHAPVGSTALQQEVAFAKAGEDVVLQVAAAVGHPPGGTAFLAAPSFGCETTTPQPQPVKLSVKDPADQAGALDVPPNFTTVPAGGGGCAGLVQGTVRWYEAGLLTLIPSLGDYLGSGSTVGGADRLIGRFYPDHLTTAFSDLPFPCLPSMHCTARVNDAASPVYGVSGAAYSGQPLGFSVTAYGLKKSNGDDALLTLYQPAGAVTMQAVRPANGDPVTSGGNFPSVDAKLVAQKGDQNNPDKVTGYGLEGTVDYQLTPPYDPNAPHAGTWSAPQPVYLRAGTQDQLLQADGSTRQVTIGSQIVPAPVPPLPPQREDGVMLVAGRLFVGNVFGSELARVPLPLAAQYWTGTQWQTNSNDNASVVATSLNFSHCTRSFAAACQLTVLPPDAVPLDGGTGLQLAGGTGRLILKAPPRGQNGSLDINAVDDATGTTATPNPAAATWLPSTVGRASFGLFKSPLIYLREVY